MKKINEKDINNVIRYSGDIALYMNSDTSVKGLLEQFDDESGKIAKFLETEDLTINDLFAIKYIYKMHENNLLTDDELNSTLELYGRYLVLSNKINKDCIISTKRDMLMEQFFTVKQALVEIGVSNLFDVDFVSVFDMLAQKEIDRKIKKGKQK